MYITVGSSRDSKTLPYHYTTLQHKDVNPDKFTNDYKVEKTWQIKYTWSSKEKHISSDWERLYEKKTVLGMGHGERR